MRVFFGLELAPDVALQVASWRDRQFAHAGRAVPPADFHVTLAFVGELGEPALERLGNSVDAWLDRGAQPGGELVLDRTGYWHKPGVYWLGAQSWPGELTRLANKLRTLTTGVGGKRDRKAFQPHITLFRRCTAAPPSPAHLPLFRLEYRHFTLFESRPGKRGVSYHPLHEWELLPPAT
ncbi:MAG: RNA 2',3'-cyclic phosphodiesterase [Halioglobus sp.]|jgi:RNA 2',3'-cyclic 3'-phosphodiesterase